MEFNKIEDEYTIHIVNGFKLNTKILKRYFNSHHNYDCNFDDYGCKYHTNYLYIERIDITIDIDSHSKKWCWIDFLNKVRTQQGYQEWYIEQFKSELLAGQLDKELPRDKIKQKVVKI